MQTDVTAEPDFFAAVAFSGARTGFVFRVGDQGIGYYRDNGGGRAMKRSRPEPAPALPQPAEVPSPPESEQQHWPPPPTLDGDALCSFCEQLDEFPQECDSSLTAAAQESQARPPSPPVHPPFTGMTEVICWRHRRAQPKRTKQAHCWPPPPPEPPPPPCNRGPPPPSPLPPPDKSISNKVEIDISSALAKWTEGTTPGSKEWVAALKAHAQPTGWAAEWTELPPKPLPGQCA